MKLILAAALAALLAGGGAQAQTAGSAMGDENVPPCSRTVTDHCIQRSEGMKAGPAMHHHAASRHHHNRKMAMKHHKHHMARHAMAAGKPKPKG
jgi:hypothetical protein